MKFKYLLSAFVYCLSFEISFSQNRESFWAFGDSVAVSFIGGTPITSFTSMTTVAASASIADASGNKLFYMGSNNDMGNGAGSHYNVWDKNDSLLPNGQQLLGNSIFAQGCLIIPVPDDTSQFIILHLESIMGQGTKLRYSIIDSKLNNGNGDVTLKNTLVSNTIYTLHLFAVKHADGRDWWILLHQPQTNTFAKYLMVLDSIYFIGNQSIGDSLGYFQEGHIFANRSGNKIVITNITGNLDLFDFDRCSGNLFNWIPLSTPPYNGVRGYFGCSFSEDESKLYVSKVDSLFQFDLNASNVNNSRQLIFYIPDSTNALGAHRLGPDGKIYISMYRNDPIAHDSLNMHMSVINDPNNLGLACNFQPYSFYLGGKRSFYGLPNIPNYELGPLVGSACDSLTAIKENFSKTYWNIYPNPASSYIDVWSNSVTEKKLDFQLFDLTGRLIFTKSITVNSTASQRIDLESLTTGIYYYKVGSDDEILKNDKLVIIK